MIQRRELLLVGAGAVAAKATASLTACAAGPSEPKAQPSKKGAQAGPKGKAKEESGAHQGHGVAPAGGGHADVVQTVAACIGAGQMCLAHCIRLLAGGDATMGDCATAVSDMVAICRATEALAASSSKHLAAMAALCVKACEECAEACVPHVAHHGECKACKKACDATISAMKDLAG